MPLHNKQIGRDGRRPETCALSGKPLAPEDVYIGVGGVEIGVKGYLYSHLTPAQKATLREQWAKDVTQANKSTAGTSKAAVKPTADHPVGE